MYVCVCARAPLCSSYHSLKLSLSLSPLRFVSTCRHLWFYRCNLTQGILFRSVAYSPRNTLYMRAHVCVCVCVCVREREREREICIILLSYKMITSPHICVCFYLWIITIRERPPGKRAVWEGVFGCSGCLVVLVPQDTARCSPCPVMSVDWAVRWQLSR
jgi:hypothetical protein